MHTLLFQLDMFLLLIFLGTGFSKIVIIREFHHGYLGDALMLLSFLFGGNLLALAGLSLRLDDTYQHFRQACFNEPYFRSPLHEFYAKYLWPNILIQKISNWLNKKFGKKI